jgi:hypothetical protein
VKLKWNNIASVLRRYALAFVCVLAPIAFGVVMMPSLNTVSRGIDLETIDWDPPIIEAKETLNPQAEAPHAPASTAEQSVQSKVEQPTEEPRIRPLARQLAGRLKYAAAWGVYLVACSAAISITIGVLKRLIRVGWMLVLVCIVAVALAGGVALILGVPQSGCWLAEPVRDKFVVSVFRAGDLKQPYLGKSSLGVEQPENTSPANPCAKSGAKDKTQVNVAAKQDNAAAKQGDVSANKRF